MRPPLSFLAALALASSSAVVKGSSCDESKCRSTRLHPWVDGDTEWTCWVPNGTDVRELCVDGYEGHIIPNQQEDYLQWFTCCPSNYTGVIEQQCSDKTCSSPDWEGGGNCWADGFQEPMSCDDPKYRHARWTGLMSLIYIQYVCCTSPSTEPLMTELFAARIVWMVLSSITFTACTIFIAALLSSKSARKQGYNLYLVFLAIPDALANWMILLRNAITISGLPVHPTVHIFLASSEYFYASSNMWLNAVIVRQIHQVLRGSNHFVKVAPPTVKTVCWQAAGIYAFAGVWFSWAFALYYRGLVWFSLTAVVNIWIVTRVLMVAPPLLYVVYVCFHVWWYKLLPHSGRTRVLSLYFLRVVIVFLVTWVPYFVIYEIAWNVTHSRWMVHISYYLGSVQGFLSVMVALSKPDVKRAVHQFVFCQKEHEEREERPSWKKRISTFAFMGQSSRPDLNTPNNNSTISNLGASTCNDHRRTESTRETSEITSREFDMTSREFEVEVDITPSLEYGLEQGHQVREERQAQARSNTSPHRRRSSIHFVFADDEEWEEEDVFLDRDNRASSNSNSMETITE